MRVICTICARGGSQGVKNKNTISLRGKPLIAHTILQAKKSKLFDTILVCSDSKRIRDTAKKWGADFTIDRPKEMATSVAAKLPVIQYAAREAGRITSKQFDIVVDLDATSPLRTVEDICQSYQLFTQSKQAVNLISGYPSRRSPYFNVVELGGDGFVQLAKTLEKPVIRRQDVPATYDMNASIYIWRVNTLLESQSVVSDRTLLYVMPEERSIDIDSPLDLKLVRFLAKNRRDLD
jgi:CMP-N,N'-diacetyllegionaminic acid synthase